MNALATSAVFAAQVAACLGQTFDTVINVPPDVAPSQIGSSTQLNVLSGGEVSNGFFAGSSGIDGVDIEVNVLGGEMDDISSYNGSLVNVHEGSTGTLRGFEGSRIAVYGGSVRTIELRSGAAADVHGGVNMDNCRVREASTLRVWGGEIGGDLRVYDGSSVHLYDGIIHNGVRLFSGASLTVHGGIFDSGIQMADDASLLITGGRFTREVVVSNLIPTNVTGGIFEEGFRVAEEAIANISGGGFDTNGRIAPSFIADSGSTVNLLGSDFSIDGIELDLEIGESLIIYHRDGEVLAGQFADGSAFSFTLWYGGATGRDYFHPDSTIRLVMVPAPSPVVLCGCTLGLLVSRRR